VKEPQSARGNLLDTHSAIFAMANSKALSVDAKTAIATGPNVLSVISYWEVMLKSMKGNLDVGEPSLWWQRALDHLQATPLLLRSEHISAVSTLPPIHKDPFDRILIAQAAVENLALVTVDAQIARYASKSRRILG
jgi:PIN domain nuclease of toxin-antitoxin system